MRISLVVTHEQWTYPTQYTCTTKPFDLFHKSIIIMFFILPQSFVQIKLNYSRDCALEDRKDWYKWLEMNGKNILYVLRFQFSIFQTFLQDERNEKPRVRATYIHIYSFHLFQVIWSRLSSVFSVILYCIAPWNYS